MKSATQTTFTLIAVLFSLLTACSNKSKDKVITVADDDPEMVAAIAEARKTLPQFWEVFEKRERGESEFSLKVKISDKNGDEHFWAKDIEHRDGKIMGTIDNDPNVVESVKFGERIKISEADISDWFYMRDGKIVGNRTLKPLFKQMPAEQVEKLRQIMADP